MTSSIRDVPITAAPAAVPNLGIGMYRVQNKGRYPVKALIAPVENATADPPVPAPDSDAAHLQIVPNPALREYFALTADETLYVWGDPRGGLTLISMGGQNYFGGHRERLTF